MPRRWRSWAVLSALTAATMALAPTTATAQYYGGGPGDRGDGRGGAWRDGGRGGAWHDHGGGYARGGFDGPEGYEDRGPPGRPGPGDRDRRGYPRGYDRHRCRNGSTGTILGAIAGGLLGNSVAGYGNRAAGTIIGGGAGALAGRAIDRDC